MDRRALICDIETYAIGDATQYLEPVEAPGNYKDPEKIAAYIKEAEQKQLGRCALDPDLARIVAVGWQLEDTSDPTVLIAQDEDVERYTLRKFWDVAEDRQFITFRGNAFDLPFLMRRSLYLSIEHPVLNLDRYRSPHLDLSQRLSMNGVLPMHSLKFYLSRFNIPCDDLTTGKDIAGLVEANDWPAVRAHCAADVRGTHALAQRLGYLQASTQPELALKDAML